MVVAFFFFNDTATTEIYTLSLHDALPICRFAMMDEALTLIKRLWTEPSVTFHGRFWSLDDALPHIQPWQQDRKSTRLNSSHANISYAVFCLKKNNQTILSATLSYASYRTS